MEREYFVVVCALFKFIMNLLSLQNKVLIKVFRRISSICASQILGQIYSPDDCQSV